MPSGKIDRAFRASVGEAKFYVPYYRRPTNTTNTYAILMTPRSGSTWLTAEVAAYDVLGCPDEYFNIESFPMSLQFNSSSCIVEYYDVVCEKMKTNEGLFGFEISYFDLEELEQEISLFALMEGERHFIVLSRRNFVAQAISLYMAIETGQYHISSEAAANPQDIPEPAYDRDKIRYWACHVLQQEFGIRQWITERKLEHLDLTYEDLVNDMEGAIRRISSHIGYLPDLPERRPGARSTRPVKRDSSSLYETRFRSECADWCAHWTSHRGSQACFFE